MRPHVVVTAGRARRGFRAGGGGGGSPPVLGTITDLDATAGDTEVALTWTPADNATTHQPQYRTPAGSGTYNNFGTALGAAASSVTVTGLTNDTEYEFRIVAGDGSTTTNSNTVTATPTAVVPPGAPWIDVDTSTDLQTVVQGWHSTWPLLSPSGTYAGSSALDPYLDELAEQQVNTLGITGVRFELTSGAYNTVDWFAALIAGTATEQDWKDNRYGPKTGGTFQPAHTDFQWSKQAGRLKTLIEANGEAFYCMVALVDIGAANNTTGDFQMRTNPTACAELFLGFFQHMETTYGYVPQGVEIGVEPDLASSGPWTATQVAAAVKATGDLLALNGFTPGFTVAGVENYANAVSWFNTIWDYDPLGDSSFPNRNYVVGLSYHRYDAPALAAIQAIGAAALADGVSAMMDEMNTTIDMDEFWQDLRHGNNGGWQQYTDHGANSATVGYFNIDTTDPTPETAVEIRDRTKHYRQVMHWVRPGAIRKTVTHTDAGTLDAAELYDFDAIAWMNTNGRYVVNLRTRAADTVYITGLPAGTYSIEYSTGSTWQQTLADVTISTGEAVPVAVPSSAVTYWTVSQAAFATPDMADHAFEDGTVGPYSIPLGWEVEMPIIDDPTGAGRGKVIDIQYRHDLQNRAFFLSGQSLSFGDRFFCRAHFYLGSPTDPATNSANRKIFYWQMQPNGADFIVPRIQGQQMRIECGNNGSARNGMYNGSPNLAPINFQQWYSLEVEILLNSAVGVFDGVARMWLDGVLIYEESDWAFISAGTTQVFTNLGVGYQLSTSIPSSESRYFDQVAFSTQRIGP